MKLVYGGPNWKEVPEDKEFKHGDYVTAYQEILKWSDAERAAIGIKPLKMQAIPEGKQIKSYTIANNAGVPVQVCEFEDILEPSHITYKTDIWRRCTDEEAILLEQALTNAPAKLRRLFNDANVIEHDSPEFVYLRAGIEKAVGVSRADVILAPSNV